MKSSGPRQAQEGENHKQRIARRHGDLVATLPPAVCAAATAAIRHLKSPSRPPLITLKKGRGRLDRRQGSRKGFAHTCGFSSSFECFRAGSASGGAAGGDRLPRARMTPHRGSSPSHRLVNETAFLANDNRDILCRGDIPPNTTPHPAPPAAAPAISSWPPPSWRGSAISRARSTGRKKRRT
jgi:hypothetical protein